MKLNELLREVTVLSMTADAMQDVTDITNDSRAVTPGCMFVAVKGFAADGHKYIPQALEKGAAVILCQEVPEGDIPYVQVTDSRNALAMTAKQFFGDPSSKLKIVGVTGTNGKTTTTNLLKHVIECCVPNAKVGLIGTNGNMIGEEMIPTQHTTPESRDLQALFARMVEAGCTHAVMEVSSHALDQGRVDGVKFDVGVFTNLTQDHLDYHHTMEAYAEAKAKLFSRCGRGVVNADDAWSGVMLDGALCPVCTLSADRQGDLVAKNICYAADGVTFEAHYGGQIYPVKLAIPGTFSVYNALTVFAAAVQLGMTPEAVREALAKAKGVKGSKSLGQRPC